MSSQLSRALVLLLVALSFLLLLPEQFWISNHAANRLDRSWYYVLCWAFLNKLSFGKDIIFTYGPLGFLTTRLPFRELWSYYIASDVLLYGGFAFVCFRFLRSSPRLDKALIFSLILFPLCQTKVISDLAILFAALGFFFACSYHQSPRFLSLLCSALYSTLAFLIKVNLGIYALGASFVLILFAPSENSRRQVPLKLFLFLLISAIPILLSPLSLGGYLRGSIELISGYGEVMRLDVPENFIYRFRAEVLALAMLLALLASLERVEGKRELLLPLVTSGFLFLLYQQSFVRSDEWHLFAMFNFAPLFLGILLFFLSPHAGKAFTPVLFLSLLFSFAQNANLFTPQWIQSRLSNSSRYLGELQRDPGAGQIAWRQPSKEILQAIGDKTVDINTGEALIALGNKLGYKPRPIFQSYAAFTPYLDKQNAEFYNSEAAPQFVLFENICIDQRYCFGDEPETKLSLLEHFAPMSRDANMLLLERQARGSRQLVRAQVGAGELRGGEWLSLPKAQGPYLIRFTLTADIQRRLSGLLLRNVPLMLELQRDNGSINRFHTASSLLLAGVIADPFLSSTESAESFFRGDFEKLPRTTAVRIVLENGEAAPDVQYELEAIRLLFPQAQEGKAKAEGEAVR